MLSSIIWEGNDVILTFHGVAGYKEIYDAGNLIYGDKRFDNQHYQIFDFTDIEKFDVDQGASRIFAKLDHSASRWNDNIKLGIVTTDEAQLTFTKDYVQEMQGSGWEIRLFSDLSDAKAWCKLQ